MSPIKHDFFYQFSKLIYFECKNNLDWLGLMLYMKLIHILLYSACFILVISGASTLLKSTVSGARLHLINFSLCCLLDKYFNYCDLFSCLQNGNISLPSPFGIINSEKKVHCCKVCSHFYYSKINRYVMYIM